MSWWGLTKADYAAREHAPRELIGGPGPPQHNTPQAASCCQACLSPGAVVHQRPLSALAPPCPSPKPHPGVTKALPWRDMLWHKEERSGVR